MVASGRFCCKTPKLSCDEFPGKARSNPRSSIDMAPSSLAKSPVSSSPCDEVPHIFTRKSRLQPGKFLITSAKRVLQQNRPIPDLADLAGACRSTPTSFCARQIALRKRPVEPERIEQAVSKIVRELESQGEADVSSEAVGEMVMEALRTLDDVAYVRFASVYRNFREAKDFETLLDELSGEEDGKAARVGRK